MFQEQKLPDIGGTLIGMPPPKLNIGGTRPPCPIGIDATASGALYSEKNEVEEDWVWPLFWYFSVFSPHLCA